MVSPAVPSVAVCCNFPDDLWNSKPPEESCSFLYYFSAFSGFIMGSCPDICAWYQCESCRFCFRKRVRAES
jgi:hypothetical protein